MRTTLLAIATAAVLMPPRAYAAPDCLDEDRDNCPIRLRHNCRRRRNTTAIVSIMMVAAFTLALSASVSEARRGSMYGFATSHCKRVSCYDKHPGGPGCTLHIGVITDAIECPSSEFLGQAVA